MIKKLRLLCLLAAAYPSLHSIDYKTLCYKCGFNSDTADTINIAMPCGHQFGSTCKSIVEQALACPACDRAIIGWTTRAQTYDPDSDSKAEQAVLAAERIAQAAIAPEHLINGTE